MHTISAEQAIAMIPDGASLMIGGFMGVGTPERLIDEIFLRKAIVSHIDLNQRAEPARQSDESNIDPARDP